MFLRINLPPWWQNREAVISAALRMKHGEYVEYRKTRWTTGHVHDTKGGNIAFLVGRVDEERHLGIQPGPDGGNVFPEIGEGARVDACQCLFLADRKLVVAETTPQISPGALETTIQKLVAREGAKRGEIGEVDVFALASDKSFHTWLKDIDRLTYLRASIHPSNPRSSPFFEDLDKAFRDAGAQGGIIEIRSEEGLERDEELPKALVGFTQAGYAKLTAAGYSGDQRRSWNSQSKMVRLNADVTDDPEKFEEHWKRLADSAERSAGLPDMESDHD